MKKFLKKLLLLSVGMAVVAGVTFKATSVVVTRNLLENFKVMVARNGQELPVPATVSETAQKRIAAGIPQNWNYVPTTVDEWHKYVADVAESTISYVRYLRDKLKVNMEKKEMGGVPVYILTPSEIPEHHRGRVLLSLHGGGYAMNPGEAGTFEGTLMAGLAGYQVIVADYRMAPDFPYPAAIDDAMAVYKAVLNEYPAEKVGVFGASTGEAMSLILPLRARVERIAFPAAIEAGTPWSDMACVGDSYFTNEFVDNYLVSYKGWLKASSEIYAGENDLKDPELSPVYSNVSDFPPTMLTSGTRDLFLSNTVRMHQKLRLAGRESDLIVFEGLSHYQYHIPDYAPETLAHFQLVREFFEKYLK